ncbi:uncharacterized protein LOC126907187 [Daktulosphaira vitifoliae]|uniref:uncharacterized protein LOC126907187 n=1 Tax=Daktulosphaira vitifoliae TaxID=58002 RepID=UPI0021AAD67C|nr:uncharacterized protein LOC126907187 [Daktulosphaira vitifoliae]
MDNKNVLVFMTILMVVQCTNTTLGNGAEDLTTDTVLVELKKKIEFTSVGDHIENKSEDNNVTEVVSQRSARQLYSPFGYPSFVQRRAYKVPAKMKKRPVGGGRMKPRRPGGRPRRRPFAGNQQSMGRFRRLPPQFVRPQQNNYIDPNDYEDGFETAVAPSYDYGGDKDLVEEIPTSLLYATGSRLPATVASSTILRKRPTYEEQASIPAAAVIHVPVRVNRPVATPAPTTPAVDSMEKLRQLVHQAMDEHFASRHQELYSDGFDKQVFSAKYKRPSLDKEKRTSAGDIILGTQSSQVQTSTQKSHADVDADGSDDRLTLAEISAYMGAKPAETVLSSGGHRYVLSDALQGYHQHKTDQQYLRYVTPLEALLEVPVGRWAYQ